MPKAKMERNKIIENDDELDLFYYDELWEKYYNKQCHICGGWAIECDCNNEFTKEDKENLRKLGFT